MVPGPSRPGCLRDWSGFTINCFSHEAAAAIDVLQVLMSSDNNPADHLHQHNTAASSNELSQNILVTRSFTRVSTQQRVQEIEARIAKTKASRQRGAVNQLLPQQPFEHEKPRHSTFRGTDGTSQVNDQHNWHGERASGSTDATAVNCLGSTASASSDAQNHLGGGNAQSSQPQRDQSTQSAGCDRIAGGTHSLPFGISPTVERHRDTELTTGRSHYQIFHLQNRLRADVHTHLPTPALQEVAHGVDPANSFPSGAYGFSDQVNRDDSNEPLWKKRRSEDDVDALTSHYQRIHGHKKGRPPDP